MESNDETFSVIYITTTNLFILKYKNFGFLVNTVYV